MKKVTVRKDELLATVKANHAAHVKAFGEAFAGYRVEAGELLEKKLGEATAAFKALADDVRSAEKPVPLAVNVQVIHFNLKVPVSHAKDYEQVIRMLEMSTDETVTLESDEFACYVMDDWGWKQEFLGMAETYSKKLIR